MRPRIWFVLFVFLLSLIGAGTIPASANVLPSGTVLRVRTTQPIFANSVRPGSRVRGVVDRSVRSGGRVIIPSGSRATLEVVNRSSNRHRVDLSVRSIRVGRTRYNVSTNDVRVGSSGRNRGRRGLVGAGVGGVVGGMVGGGTGLALGATTGAGVGLVSAGRGRTQLSVPPHTQLR